MENMENIETPKKSFPTKTIKIIAIVLGSLIVLSLIAFLILNQVLGKELNIDTYYQGILVEEVELGGKTKEEAKEAIEAVKENTVSDVKIDVVYGEIRHSYTKDDFSFDYHIDEVLDEAYQVARDGHLFSNYKEMKDLKETPRSFFLEPMVTDESIDKAVESITNQVNRPMSEGKVEEFLPFTDTPFVYTDGHSGIEINQESLKKDLIALLKQEKKEGEITLQATETPCEVTTAEIQRRTQFAANYSTKSTNTAAGNHNMALALSKINGTVLNPGETLAFNKVVGDSTTSAGGWKAAGAIVNGKLVDEYGGGICQASTTLYGAVLRADLEVIERHNHSWPSTYVPIGQDASINYGSADFEFKNNTEYPIYIGAKMDGATLSVVIYRETPADWDEIRIESWKTTDINPDAPLVKTDNSLAPGEEKIERKARVGSRAEGSKLYYKGGEKVNSAAIAKSYYRPLQGIILVGPSES